MKNLKTLLLPAFVLLAGVGSAFATHLEKNDNLAIIRGYVFREGETPECVNSLKDCDTSGSFTCTADIGMGSEDLYQLNGTVCPNKLTHTQPN
ncbi:MAG: DUF6520 family protein [Chryseobacterium sp.]|uniref:DUF6520 family protein n=1 Tax=Chryseobacterium TaxID=59732 RepID=UPI001AE86231|nr:DUF6520 family protein [Chryseobacterium jejuense]MBP2617849.1 hypothetical protein [Chryseobacterium jejuense]